MTSGPSLHELPPPPAGREGWPWTAQPLLPLDAADATGAWPRISVTTLSLNQGHYVEEAIRSILLQGYPAVELVVVDGGSTDGTVDVLKRYDPWIARWRSEPDQGVVDAANKALAIVTGDLLTWVASDDVLLPGALHAFARAHREAPDCILLGDVRLVDAEGRRTSVERPANVSLQALADPLHSEVTWYGVGMCVPRSLYATNGPFDDSVPYVTDYDWTCRLMLRSAAVHYVRQEVIGFRMHAGSTSVKHRLAQSTQLLEVAERYWQYVPDLDAKARAEYPLRKASMFLAHDRRWVPLWDRVAGARALLDSFLCYPRIVANPRFLKLCVRAALPKALLRSNPWRTRT